MKNPAARRGNDSRERDERAFPPPGKTPREDALSVMRFYKLPKAFPPAVRAEAKALPRAPSPTDLKGRLDLRRKFIFTCDPVSARDFDDALSLETDRHGNRVLGVHIADVAHFVRPGSALDREAYKRSTSVYLCDRVVPMLPEELCNGVCSLVPNEDRLAFSVFMTFDSKGEMIARRFAKSVIRSKARFAYEQVMEILKGASAPRLGKRETRTIREIAALAQTLRQRRFAAGALDLEVPEAEVILDDDGRMTGLVARPYDESHQMIEECMVAANEAVAKELWTKGVKILARLHESPDEEKLLLLRSELRGMGVRMGDISKPKAFARFLKEIKTHPLYPTIAVMILRSMKKAVYDSTMIGHFGLAKAYYAHFTSPIRRYPDLTLHRQLADYLAKRPCKVAPKTLAGWAEHASAREEVATEAERGLLEIKKYRLLEEQLTDGNAVAYPAVISKCTPFGCFVEIPEIATSGLIHISRLARAFVRFVESDQSLACSERSWHVGDRLTVRVTFVDFENRRLDFVPVEAETRCACARDRSRKIRKGKQPEHSRKWN